MRRLFLDEFVSDLDLSGDKSLDATIGLERAEDLYEKVFVEYGDDSVAQLGGVHLACEQASNLLTKILERGRLMSYLEQSTRYINYDARLGGRYRFYRDADILNGPFGTRYVGDMDRMFDSYSTMVESVTEHIRKTVKRDSNVSDFVFKQATRAKGSMQCAEFCPRRLFRTWVSTALVKATKHCCCACADTICQKHDSTQT